MRNPRRCVSTTLGATPNSTSSSSIRRLLIKFSVRFLMRQRSDISSILDESMRAAPHRICSPKWPWSWMPPTASSPRCRWCRSQRGLLGNRRGSWAGRAWCSERGGPHRLDHLAAFLRWTPQFLLPPVREILRGGEPEGKVPLRMFFQASVHLLRRRPSVRRVRSLAVV